MSNFHDSFGTKVLTWRDTDLISQKEIHSVSLIKHIIFRSARLCQQSSPDQNLSIGSPSAICHLWRNFLWTSCADCFQILTVGCPGPYASFSFFNCWNWNAFSNLAPIFFIFDNSWLYWSKKSECYYSLKSLFFFKHLLNFLLNGSHKSTVLVLWILSFRFFRIFSQIGKPKPVIISNRVHRRAKLSEMFLVLLTVFSKYKYLVYKWYVG